MLMVKVYGTKELGSKLRKLEMRLPDTLQGKSALRVIRSAQEKARFIVETETVTHTGTLRNDILIKPVGKTYILIAGQHAPYAYLIEHGRKAIIGYKFIPTQDYPLEGFSVRDASKVIAEAKGIHFMKRAAEHADTKAQKLCEEEMRKVLSECDLI